LRQSDSEHDYRWARWDDTEVPTRWRQFHPRELALLELAINWAVQKTNDHVLENLLEELETVLPQVWGVEPLRSEEDRAQARAAVSAHRAAISAHRG
jgi:hypothetical protein